MTNIKQCTQTRCVYHGTSLCPRCDDCGCSPNFIDEDCPNCWNCLKDEGYVRQGKRDEITNQNKKKVIIMEVKIK
jgi:hypothetical protein